MQPDELRALTAYLRERQDDPSPILLPSNRGTPITRRMLDVLMKRYGITAGIPAGKRHFPFPHQVHRPAGMDAQLIARMVRERGRRQASSILMHDHSDFQDGLQLARAIVDTVREPLVVLNGDLRVVAASRSFYKTFGVNQREVYGRLLYELGGGQWDIPKLRELLEDIIPHRTTIEAYEVEHDFPTIGRRTMLLNARQVANGDRPAAILLAIEDVTRQRAAEHEKDDLLRQKDLLLREMRHRVANSLQIIASILLLKARTVQSEETRHYLQDAHQRVLTVATVQQQLEASGIGDEITIGPYLAKLCTSLAASMIGERWPLSVKVRASEGAATSNHVVSLGLITTELLINALKHAFPNDAEGEILVSYDADGADWQLSVSDNGIGRPADADDRPQGLGTSIVEALAKQLGARVSVSSSARGTTVSITHAAAWMPRPADQATPEGGPSQGT